ncbi:substrate-binding domain-containing protein [Amaricoccus macauensis]|uniref:substrate-binding domain-containing protein n=1 Tax=Amaricoccus macauensis TaxID=57001 RepID=UPI003C7D118C
MHATVRGCAAALIFLLAGHPGEATAQTADLVSRNEFRVCADPANFPISSEDGSGFENKIAELLARELDLPLEYTWYPDSTGFVRNTLGANRCDVVIGYAQLHELVQNTNHYYTSRFVIVVPEASRYAGISQISDPDLEGARIGLVAGSPAASHMARNGLISQARSYPLFVDRRYSDPSGDMLGDLEAGEIDVAILWGPIGGPLVKTKHPSLVATPLMDEEAPPKMFYRITMGVRRGELDWSRKLNSLIRRNQDEINDILLEAGVPLMNDMGTAPLEPKQ